MRIVEIREMAAPIRSSIRNAYIDFSKMAVSVVAVITDVKCAMAARSSATASIRTAGTRPAACCGIASSRA